MSVPRSWIVLGALVLFACRGPANRDRHGPADVDDYVERLARAERVERLQPELVVELLALPSDAVVADIGCGPGVFALPFARACPAGVVYAVDVEPRQLDALRARLLEEEVANVIPVLASYEDPHLPPGRADVIFVADTYHHLDERVAYLRVLAEGLAPGGRLVLLEYTPGDLPVGPPADHKVDPDARYLELELSGWELVKRFETHEYHDFEIWRRGPR